VVLRMHHMSTQAVNAYRRHVQRRARPTINRRRQAENLESILQPGNDGHGCSPNGAPYHRVTKGDSVKTGCHLPGGSTSSRFTRYPVTGPPPAPTACVALLGRDFGGDQLRRRKDFRRIKSGRASIRRNPAVTDVVVPVLTPSDFWPRSRLRLCTLAYDFSQPSR